MKTRFGLILIFTLILGPVPSLAHAKRDSSDVGMIESLVSEYTKAYNERNEAALQLLWAQDGDLISVPGSGPASGQQAILEEIRKNQNRDYKGGSISATISNIRFLGKNAALVEAKGLISGVTTPGGTVLPPIAHYMIMAVEKTKKAWFINSVRYFSALPIVRPLR